MTLGTKEHYEILDAFEKSYRHYRLDREEKALWAKGQIYQSGETNSLYRAFILGYSFGRVNAQQEAKHAI